MEWAAGVEVVGVRTHRYLDGGDVAECGYAEDVGGRGGDAAEAEGCGGGDASGEGGEGEGYVEGGG